jgi:hypothetical protein
MEPDGSVPCSQEPTTGFYPESDQSSHHGKACPQDGGDGLQMWKVTVNKQQWTADKSDPPVSGLGVGLQITHRKKRTCYEIFQKSLVVIGGWRKLDNEEPSSLYSS